MKEFKAPVEDIEFCLREIVAIDQLPEWDQELCSEVINVFARFAEQEIAPLNEPGDREGCRLENGRVHMPAGLPELFQRYAGDGWQGLSLPPALDGQGMGAALQAVISEIFSGANHSLQMIVALVPGAARVLLDFGSEALQQQYIPRLASGELLATMCLTEAGAGSDLSEVRCRALADEDGWRIEGEKIFISGGDQDLSEGILHLVLARTGAGGTRGLSLFACPSALPDGSVNGVSVLRIEEKMGLHASPTCQLQFDGARAELIGQPGAGLKCMFAMMNHARIDVALQGVAHAARAFDIAAAYAAERKQGKDQAGAAVTIDQHADVRQMLDDMAALAIGGRALVYQVMLLLEQGRDEALVSFLTPVAKFFCTEAGTRAASLAQDVLGGYGYLSEYLVEQTYRDARITTIYEGANGIHALALLRRELARGGDDFVRLVEGLAQEGVAETVLAGLDCWSRARACVDASGASSACARDFMRLTGKVLYLALWSKICHRADAAPDVDLYRRAAARVLRRVPCEIACLAALVQAETVA
ncbi:MAG: acyl-CoA dehydrogenase [Gammaproteobacteria bacterium]|nr:acyl-CoA dehydrogenase [Gammaproteobacteria bacterium]